MSRYEPNLSKTNSTIVVIISVIVLILLLIWLFLKNQNDNQIERMSMGIPIEKIVPENKQKEQLKYADGNQLYNSEKNETGIDLFTEFKDLKLEDSDTSFRQKLGTVSNDLSNWFNAKDIIKKYILIINDLSQNQIIYKNRKFLKISQKFLAKEDAQGLYLPEESYTRYDRLANAIEAIDVQKGLNLYLAFRSLFQQVYDGFSYPADYRLEDIFMKAAASVIESPVIEGRIALIQDTLKYKYADKKLESLSSVQKQMIRMGPENTKKIQIKLRKLVEAIVRLSE